MNQINEIRRLYTLGPQGTNCEFAAKKFLHHNQVCADIILMPTLEAGAAEVLSHEDSILMGCIAYPNLHNLMFSNLRNLKLVEVFVTDTLTMVMASRSSGNPQLVYCHPATESLIAEPLRSIPTATSNASAAMFDGAPSEAGSCITTLRSSQAMKLTQLRSFGSIEMGFSIHMRRTNDV